MLAGHGVEVTVVRRAAALAERPVDADTTVLVTSTDDLGRATARALGAHDRGRRRGAGRSRRRPCSAPWGCRSTVGRRRRGRPAPTAGCTDDLLAGLDRRRRALGRLPRRRGAAPVTGCFAAPRERGAAALVARVDRADPTYAVGGDRRAHQRPGRARRQRRGRAAAARPARPAGLVRPRPSRRRSPATRGSVARPAAPLARARRCGWSRVAVARDDAVARPAARAAGASSRCRWWSRPSRPPRAAAGSTAGSGDRAHAADDPPRAPPRAGWPRGCGSRRRRRPAARWSRRGPRHRSATPREVARPARPTAPRPRRRPP